MKPLLQDGYIVLDSDLQLTPHLTRIRRFEVWPCHRDAADVQRCHPDPALREKDLVRLKAHLVSGAQRVDSVQVILEPSGLPESPSGELADGMTLHKSSRDRGGGGAVRYPKGTPQRNVAPSTRKWD